MAPVRRFDFGRKRATASTKPKPKPKSIQPKSKPEPKPPRKLKPPRKVKQPREPKLKKKLPSPTKYEPASEIKPPPSPPLASLIIYSSLNHLIQTYESQYLVHATDTLSLEHHGEITDYWNELVDDRFRRIWEVELKCGECGVVFCGVENGFEMNAGSEEKHIGGGGEGKEGLRGDIAEFKKQIENGIEDVRTEMERKDVLEITEGDVDVWEWRLRMVVERWGEEVGRRWGGCAMRMKGKPGTLVDGKLVLEEGEEKLRVAWMKRLWGEDAWMKHDFFTGGQEAQLQELESKEVEMGGMEVMDDEGAGLGVESTKNGVVGGMISQGTAEKGLIEGEGEDESEEGGIAARLLRELEMEDYEYKGKETGLYRESVGFGKESDDVRDARLLRVFGFGGV